MRIRPHHGMCLAFFEGKGYSDGFTAHMEQMQRLLLQEDPAVCLEPVTDEICACCPNNREGVCISAEKVDRYDRAVLARCGIAPGERLRWSAFSRLVQERILAAGARKDICGDCQWNGVCAKHEV